jgi:ligand-binding sensor domain-containing protein
MKNSSFKKYYSLCLIFLLCNNFLLAQIPMATWRTHLTYHNARSLAITPTRIYAVSDNGLFYVDKQSNEIVIVNKSDGLSHNQFAKIAYHKTLKKLLITYRNGNIDILKDSDNQLLVKNLPEIANSNRLSEKGINHIVFYKNLAYLSTDFGVVQVDMEREIIAESYLQLGTNGSTLKIWASAVAQDSLFLAAGTEGLLAASLAPTVNRLDFRNWKKLTLNTVRVRSIASKNDKLYFSDDGLGIFEYDKGRARLLNIPALVARNFNNISSSSDNQKVIVCAAQLLVSIDANNTAQSFSSNNLISPQEADYEGNTLWVADSNNGVLKNTDGSQFLPNYPRGTYSLQASHLAYMNEKIVATSGGFTPTLQAQNRLLGFYVFDSNQWTNFNGVDKILQGIVPIPTVRNLVTPTYATQEQKLYFATLNDGILQADLVKKQFSVINTANSNLPNNQVTSVLVDNRGILWAGVQQMRGDNTLIYRRNTNGTWQPFPMGSVNQGNVQIPVQLLVDEGNNIWALFKSPTDNSGVIAVLNENGTVKVLENIDLPSKNINCMVLDKDGSLWIGTDKGLRYIISAATVLMRSQVQTSLVVFEQRPLFRDENVTALQIDGGNRKWIGVRGKGAWLFSPDGSENLLHFTAQNSPLLANNIQHIAVNGKDGEVFFATEAGIVSYRSDATEATNDFAAVRIFPNPVPPNFQGVITIDGLAESSFIKITDVTGRLVHETQAVGGTAVWRGTDYTGRRADTGVYLVFCTNKNGEQSLVGKIAFIN